jgi:capsular polysaccharide biosynthesis protein
VTTAPGTHVVAGATSQRVLIGPTYLSAIEKVDWPESTVKYLKDHRSPEAADSAPFLYYDAASMRKGIARSSIDKELGELIIALNRDVNCFFLAERERQNIFDGPFLAPIHLSDCARYAWSLLKEYKPNLVVFHNYPHALFTYVLLKIALHLNIRTLLVHFSALPWRMCISRFLEDGSTTKLRLRGHVKDEERESITSYMTRLQSSHEKAIPATDLNWIAPNQSTFSIREDLKLLPRDSVLKCLARMYMKARVYRSFRAYVTDQPEEKPYVVFLLHYQPEEATLPRGGIFAQQLNAILKLRSVLPDHVRILVKENRATFRAPFTLATSVRSQRFYHAITSIRGAYLVPVERDTFELVDNALAVATITGSVGLEALCRGKRVLIFGEASYKHFSGVTRLDTARPHDSDLSGLASNNWTHDPAATERDMQTEFLSSIGQAAEDNDKNFRSQQIATVEAVQYIASNVARLVSQP